MLVDGSPARSPLQPYIHHKSPRTKVNVPALLPTAALPQQADPLSPGCSAGATREGAEDEGWRRISSFILRSVSRR